VNIIPTTLACVNARAPGSQTLQCNRYLGDGRSRELKISVR